jgi:eukaryotic-like serine/threonine-protein kinase
LQELQTTLPMGSILRERYVVEGLLGKGGFGAVYLVSDVRVKGNLFALKEAINPQKKDRERFVFEGDLLRRLDHLSLPRVYRVFEDDTHRRAYMLMDYIEGPNLEVLRQRQPGKRFSLLQVLTILAPIVDAVNYLHNQNPPILHRDIKPSNIIVPASGDEAVLVDFGIAKEYNPDATTTAFRTGSPGYAPPELYSTGTSTRSDIYELGATFYALLTGSVPADALHRITYIGSGQNDPLELVNKLNPDIPQHIANAIHRALAINSKDRFSSVEQFWQAFNTQPAWKPLNIPVIVLAAPSTEPVASQKQMDTPIPAVVEVQKQSPAHRSGIFRVLLLALLLLLVTSGIGAGLFSYFSNHPAANSTTPTSQAQANGTVTVAISPTSHPTQAPTVIVPTSHPKATPTSLPVVMPTPHPTMQPTPRPTPAPSSTPTPVPYPNVAGNYNGTIDDTTANVITGMALSIQQQAGQGAISGYFTVNPPLVGSGNYTGTVNTNKYIQFIVQAYKNNGPLYFWGWVQPDGSLNGDYCSLNKQNRCNPNAGASGTWNVAPIVY